MLVVNSDEDHFMCTGFSLKLLVCKMRRDNCACLRYAINKSFSNLKNVQR